MLTIIKVLFLRGGFGGKELPGEDGCAGEGKFPEVETLPCKGCEPDPKETGPAANVGLGTVGFEKVPDEEVVCEISPGGFTSKLDPVEYWPDAAAPNEEGAGVPKEGWEVTGGTLPESGFMEPGGWLTGF